MASDATGTYHATGTILTQQTKTVGVRNPPDPPQSPYATPPTVNINVDSETERINAP